MSRKIGKEGVIKRGLGVRARVMGNECSNIDHRAFASHGMSQAWSTGSCAAVDYARHSSCCLDIHSRDFEMMASLNLSRKEILRGNKQTGYGVQSQQTMDFLTRQIP